MKLFFLELYNFNRRKFINILFWTLISGLMGGVGVVMLIPMLSVLEISADSNPLLVSVLSKLDFLTKNQLICILLGVYFILVLIKTIISAKLSVWNVDLVQTHIRDMRLDFYNALSKANWQKLKSYKKIQLENYLIGEIGRISSANTNFIGLINLVVVFIVNLIISLCMSIPVTIIVLLMGVLYYLLFSSIRKKSREYGKRIQETSETFFEEIDNQMSGVKEIRSYGIENKQASSFDNISTRFKNEIVGYTKLSTIPNAVMSIVSAMSVVIVFMIAYLVFHMSIGRIAVMIYVLGRLIPGFSSFQNYSQTLLTTLPVYENMRKVISDLKESQVQDVECGSQFVFDKAIEYKNIAFKYNDSEEDLIEDASFELRRGEITAFVGKSGAGKTTLVDIVLGFLEPISGEIKVDGKVVDSSSYAAFCKGVSYIPQEPLLLNSTVRDNIATFHPGISDEDIIDALKKAQVWDVVNKLPSKLDTVIGDKGIRLSGGERQRIVLARALAGNPKLLVLDEATSSLDYENEKKIRDILISLRGELTVLLVAHRLSTIQSAEHVIVIENGTITEDGSYKELINNKEGYLGRMVNE